MAKKNEESASAEAKVEDGLAATVRKQGETIKKLVACLEKVFGIDIDRDGKVGLLVAALGLMAIVSFAVSPSTSTVWNVVDASGTNDLVQVDSSGNIKADGTVTADGASITSSTVGNQTVSGTLTLQGTPALAAALSPTGTPVVAAGITLHEGYSTNANVLISITVGGTNYVIPAFSAP